MQFITNMKRLLSTLSVLAIVAMPISTPAVASDQSLVPMFPQPAAGSLVKARLTVRNNTAEPITVTLWYKSADGDSDITRTFELNSLQEKTFTIRSSDGRLVLSARGERGYRYEPYLSTLKHGSDILHTYNPLMQ